MKKILLPVLMLFAALTVYAQTQKAPPQYINYQAILRDKEGKILAGKKVVVEFQILKYNGFSFDIERAETHTLNTTDLGLINLNIGKGSSINGLPFKAISTINWADSLRLGVTVIDGQNGQRIVEPTIQNFASTPYTLLAQNSLKADTAKVALQSLGDTLWKKSGDTAIYTLKKYIGVGTDKPASQLHIEGNLYQSTGNGFVWHKFSNQNRTKYFELSPGGDFYLYDKNSEFYNMIFRANGDANIGNAMTLVKSNNNVGIGTSAPQAKLHVEGAIFSTGGFNTLNPLTIDLTRWSGPSGRDAINIVASADNNAGVILTNKPAFYFFSTSEQRSAEIQCRKVYTNDEVDAKFIVVRGADIIEKAHNTEGVQAGEVVIIDPTQTNHVKRSQKAYDKTVVGVVSGAGGIKHGMQLAQEGMLDGNTNFAIAGRVYVKVTGKVKAGDLLTSSNVAGHAMKAKNRKKAIGAVIGKALTAPNTEGLVLMLVMMR